MRLNTQKKPGRCLSSVKCACALVPFVLLCTGLVSLGAEAKLEPNSILSLVFPDLPDTLMTKSGGEKQSARMSAELPENHSRKGQFPLFIFLTGGGGGHGEAKPSARELVGNRDFICVNLPQFKRDLNTTEPFRGLSISPEDFDLISRAYQTMLQKFEYSNVGMALLGHVIALKAGTHFESLVANRICRPLHMDSTCIAPTPELKARLAMGHDESGKLSPRWKLQAYSPAGDVHSTANDLQKYKQTETLRVTKVFPKSPASQAGLSAGMIIQKIENVPTAGKSVAECQRLLRASSSPKVRLELINPERKESNSVEATRGKFLTSV